MRHSGNACSALWLAGSIFALIGCGGGGSGAANGDGTVTEMWAGYCTATFTADTPITDSRIGKTVFTARVGNEFLVSSYIDTFQDHATLLYLTGAAPYSFDVKHRADGTWPFTSNCTIDSAVSYDVAFIDVTVFAEKELTTKLCELSAGSVLNAEGTATGYMHVGSNKDGEIYEVILGPFAPQCGGQDRGFIDVALTESFGFTTWLVPVIPIVGPN